MNDNFSINKVWTIAEGIQARKMNDDGYTAREIGTALGRSRNSVIGWFHRQQIRLKTVISTEAKMQKARSAYKKRGRQAPKPLPAEPKISKIFINSKTKEPILQPVDDTNVTFMKLTNMMCKAVIGEAKGIETIYCGEKPMKAGHSWCAFHHSIYYGSKRAEPNEERQIVSRGNKIFGRFGSGSKSRQN